MRAAGLDYERRTLEAFDLPEPAPPGAGDVLFKIRECGVCGTDRELASFRFGFPPEGEHRLALGHEALGQVVETGAGVTGVSRGDWVVPAVRRPCVPACRNCANGRRDLCLSLNARERGIFGLHGYMTEHAVDAASDLVRVPGALADVAVLIEPLSVVEKAVARALLLHPGGARNALVLGAGPIGLLAGMVLRLRGLDAAVFSLEHPEHPRARLAAAAGLRYLRSVEGVSADIVIEATGSPDAAFAGFRALGPLGVYGVLGSPNATGEVPFLDMLVKNQVVFGSVNAGPDAFAAAVDDLACFERSVLASMIHRVAFDDFRETVPGRVQAVKTVHVVA